MDRISDVEIATIIRSKGKKHTLRRVAYEDGFEIPMQINEVVVVEQDDYAMGKMISAKMDAKHNLLKTCLTQK